MLNEVLDKLHIVEPKALQITTDSRNCPQGSVFFGLKGDRFDGNQYAEQAIINGASLVVVDNPKAVCCITPDKYLLVNDSLLALQTLAREWRERLNIPIIGITGTNGKTTTKELTSAVLQQKYCIHYTQGNLNNQIGVPLTLLQLNTSHEMAIVEMGASHPGDIKELVEIAESQFGLITNIGKAHLLGFGSIDGVRRTKGELYDYLRNHNGTAFLNTNDTTLCTMAYDLPTIPYLDGSVISCDPTLTMTVGNKQVQTHLIGAYNADNIRAAITIGLHFGISLDDCINAIEHYVPTNNRSMLKQTNKNTIIVDAYNANVSSMTAALESIAHSGVSDKTLILGDMLELGDVSIAEHQGMVDKINALGFKDVYLVGENFGQTTNTYKCFESTDKLAQYLTKQPITHRTILLKGSRGMKLETLIPFL